MVKQLQTASSSVKSGSIGILSVILLSWGMTFDSFGQGLEGIVVEKYYVADHLDASDSLSQGLAEGTITYRIWVDMEAGYKLLSVYGAPGHELLISTTTSFFNDTINGKIKAQEINHTILGKNPLLLDSYIAFSGSNRADLAVYKEDDKDGSVLERSGKFLEGAIMERGMLMSAHPEAGLPLRDVDGMMDGDVPAVITFGYEFEEFDRRDASEIRVDNGAWASMLGKGLAGPYPEKNYIFIAQVSTDGELSLKLNLQLRGPDGETLYYVAENPEEGQLTHPSLTYPNPDQSSIRP